MVEPVAAENGKKLQQIGEEYTHGGVKKTKFAPKVPTRRLKKLSDSSAKSEPPPVEAGLIPKEFQRLLQQQQGASDGDGHHGQDRHRPSHQQQQQRTSTVAFGFGGAGFQHNNGAGSKSSQVGTSRVGISGTLGAVKNESVTTTRAVPTRAVEEFLHADEIIPDGDCKNLEVFDRAKYFPVTLPLRKPINNTRCLDEEEFAAEEVEDEEKNEDGVEAAEELGLTDTTDKDTLFFFQFPKGLPVSLNSSGKEMKPQKKSVRLEDLGRGGAMGKLLVYESGVVKFKVGDVVFDALPGTECTFAQEVAAVNTTSKQCSFVGEVHRRVVLAPNIVDVLPDLTDLRTKR